MRSLGEKGVKRERAKKRLGFGFPTHNIISRARKRLGERKTKDRQKGRKEK